VVKVSVEVRGGGARFDVAVQAESIQRAVSIVAGRFPADDARVKFPIDPEGYFVKDPAARAGIVGLKRAEEMAA
jgi:hypothetical protein